MDQSQLIWDKIVCVHVRFNYHALKALKLWLKITVFIFRPSVVLFKCITCRFYCVDLMTYLKAFVCQSDVPNKMGSKTLHGFLCWVPMVRIKCKTCHFDCVDLMTHANAIIWCLEWNHTWNPKSAWIFVADAHGLNYVQDMLFWSCWSYDSCKWNYLSIGRPEQNRTEN